MEAMPTDPHAGKGLLWPSLHHTPSALRAYRASPSNQKSLIHPLAHPPSENPDYPLIEPTYHWAADAIA